MRFSTTSFFIKRSYMTPLINPLKYFGFDYDFAEIFLTSQVTNYPLYKHQLGKSCRWIIRLGIKSWRNILQGGRQISPPIYREGFESIIFSRHLFMMLFSVHEGEGQTWIPAAQYKAESNPSAAKCRLESTFCWISKNILIPRNICTYSYTYIYSREGLITVMSMIAAVSVKRPRWKL